MDLPIIKLPEGISSWCHGLPMPSAEVILVVSTCGLGEFPANSKQTWLKLQSQDGSGHIMDISWENGGLMGFNGIFNGI